MLTAGALTREILVYLLVFAALSALLEPAGERLRRVTPWLAGLGVFAGGYLAHSIAARPYLQIGSQSGSYLNGGPAFMLNAIQVFSGSFAGRGAVLGMLVVLGLAGAVASRRRVGTAFSAFALSAIALPLLAMLLFGNVAYDAAGSARNYWGILVIPLALALWPASALLLIRRRTGA